MYLPLSAFVAICAVWASLDAAALTRDRNLPRGPGGYSPLEWGLLVLLLWIVGFPLYLVRRTEARNRPPLSPAERAAEARRLEGRRNPLLFAAGAFAVAIGSVLMLAGWLETESLMFPVGVALFATGALALWRPWRLRAEARG